MALLFFISQIIAIYYNIALTVMIIRTFRVEYKYPYYPLLFLIMILNILFVLLTTLVLLVTFGFRDLHTIDIALPSTFIIATSYPNFIGILDFLLYQFGIGNKYSNLTNLVFYCFAYDLGLKTVLGILTFVGYFVILVKVIGQSRKVGKAIDFTVIKQAVPIASFQFATNIMLLFMHMGTSQGFLSFGNVCVVKYTFTQLLCIVVPFSIILGNRNRRQKFGDFGFCCKTSSRILPVDYEPSAEATETAVNSIN
ncbi:unnamed protein product [Caenorhabditis bovis]|uniref:Serpentine receptor class gamma n=1 Tax=Caenorhabditis bovis TaxID=2654633 RepID=A0A8S1E8H5_9PELO|nr:unnamed protein product [Caenorhabditis bovis]